LPYDDSLIDRLFYFSSFMHMLFGVQAVVFAVSPPVIASQTIQIVGIAIGVVSLLLGVVYFRANRQRKALAYNVVSNTPLLTLDEELDGQVSVSFEGEPVGDLHVVVLAVANTGNVPIEQDDYETPLSFEFSGAEACVLSAQVVKTRPPSLNVSVDSDRNAVTLQKALLNSQDLIHVKVLVTRFQGSISASARIAGVRDVREFKPQQRLDRVMTWTGIGLTGVGFAGFSFFNPWWLGLIAAAAGYVLVGASAWSVRGRRRLMTA
jgi:hypothetical protein